MNIQEEANKIMVERKEKLSALESHIVSKAHMRGESERDIAYEELLEAKELLEESKLENSNLCVRLAEYRSKIRELEFILLSVASLHEKDNPAYAQKIRSMVAKTK